MAGTRRNLQGARAEGDGVVARDAARVATAQDAVEVAGSGSPGGRRLGGRAREAGGEVGEELGEKGVGGLQSGDAAEPQFAHEPVLQRAPQPLNAALGLRRLRLNKADAEVDEDAAEVRRVLRAAQLFIEGPVRIVALEDVEAIAVEGHRHAVGATSLAEDGEITVQILGGTEPQRERDRSGVVDEAVQRGRRPARFEPGEGTGVELHELPESRRPLAAAAVLGRAPTPVGGPAQGDPHSPDGGPADGQRVPLLELLGEMHVIEALVGRGHQAHDLLDQRGRQAPWRGSTAAAMEQAPHALGAHPLLETSELTDADLQRPRAFGIRDLAGQGRFDQPGPRHFLPAHREGLHEGRTFSRSS